jgi:hypothetical protein
MRQVKRNKFKPHKRAQLSIAASYRTYLGKLMGVGARYKRFNFFSDILSGLKVQEDSSIRTFSMQVYQGHYLMKYSPTMVEELDVLAAGFVIAHELGHPALGHFPRMLRWYSLLEVDPEAQNKAATLLHIGADYALNSWLIDDLKVITLSELKTGIGRPQETGETYEGKPLSTYAGIHPSDVGLPPLMSMEWYAMKLAETITNAPDWDVSRVVNPSGNPGEATEGPTSDASGTPGGVAGNLLAAARALTDEQLKELQDKAGINPDTGMSTLANPAEGESLSELSDKLARDFTRRMVSSMASIKQRGNAPGNLEEWLTELCRPPEVCWEEVLRGYAKTARPSRRTTTYSRPRRKHIDIPGIEPLDYPGKKKDPRYSIVWAIDTSASMSSLELQEIFVEMKGILSSNEGTCITVVECDTRIGKIYELEKESDLDTKVSGRGGTRFDPVFHWITSGEKDEETGIACTEEVDLLIYATDGECVLPAPEVRIPHGKVIWLLSSRGVIPTESYSGITPKGAKGFASYGRYLKLPGK